MQKLNIPQNLTTLAYESIKRGILEGKLSDGLMTEEALSLQLGISKSPIREALNTLHNEGLIRIEPRRGAYLRRFSVKEVHDLYEVRDALETYAVLAAKITPTLLSELEESIARTINYLSQNDKIRHIEEDARFHSLLSNAADNAELMRLLKNVQNQIWLFRGQTYELSSSSAPEAHQRILEALRSGDTTLAARATREHIQNVRRRLIAYLQANDENIR
jgi:DNA-binding GntR family transcriptional regulator